MAQITELPLTEAFWFQEGPGVRNWQFTTSGIKLLNVANITKLGELDLSKTDRYLGVEEVQQKYRHFLVQSGDLLIASSGISFDSDGLLRTRGAFVNKSHLPLCLNTSTIRFKAKRNISDLRFLKFWLDSNQFRKQITQRVTGSAQQNFGPSHLESLQISLPELPEQERIASILERADRLRRTRRYADRLSNTFLQSVFLEMFRPQVAQTHGWKVIALKELVDRLTNGYVGPTRDIYVQSGVPYLLSKHVKANELTFDGQTFVSPEFNRKNAKSILKAGDVLVVQTGHAGESAVVPKEHEGHNCHAMIVITPKPGQLLGQYLSGFFNSPIGKESLKAIETGATLKHLNCSDVERIRLALPPRALQQKFAAIVRRFERLRAQQREAERQDEHLFQTLLHRAFNCEL